jgi:SAM-dependent methyltransferase
VDHARRRGLADVKHHDLTQPWPLPARSVQAVVLLDVLEHTADPVQVLKHAANVLVPGGGIVLTAPAHRWLYGQWDRSLGHRRRYTRRELRQHAEAALLQVSWLSYWNAFSLPAAVAVRGYQRCFPRQARPDFPRVSPVVNKALLGLASVERWCLQRFPSPLGLSLVGVLRK